MFTGSFRENESSLFFEIKLDELKILSDIMLNIPARPLNNAQMWRVS